jgi:putative tricarboxylic transport membrane protein
VAQVVVGTLILPVCVWLVNRPRPYLAGFIYALILSGVYTIHSSLFDVGIVLSAGVLGYFLRFFGYPVLPAVLGVVLGGLIESNYRRSLVISGGDNSIFLEDPIAVGFLVLATLIIIASLAKEWRTARAAKAKPSPA